MRFLPEIAQTVLAWLIGGVVVAAILHSIWRAGDAIYEGYLERSAGIEIHAIIEGFRQMYEGQVDPAGTNLVPAAIQSGICTSAMVRAGVTTYCLGPWGEDNRIMLTSNAGIENLNNSINITMTGLNREACITLATSFATSNPGLVRAAINKTEIFLVGPRSKAPFSPASINEACNQSSNQNTLLLTYRMQ